MNSTPNSDRKHIAIFGKTNVGKSSLLNKIIGQDISLVSSKEGTTTDPVKKAIELIPYGPVIFIDTAGLGDKTELGELRIKKTIDVLKKADLALYVVDETGYDDFNKWKKEAEKFNLPYIVVINKSDELDEEKTRDLTLKFKNYILVSCKTGNGIKDLKEKIGDCINQIGEEKSLIKGLVPYNGTVILVVPVDSEAPKGRLILPQVQVIRDCLDNGIKSYVVRDTELEQAISDLKNIDLVITDSQAFKTVDKLVPKNIKLTSFSIIYANHKVGLKIYLESIEAIRNLKENSNILISESCTHNVSHEDIGRVKIPKMLQNYIKGKLNFDFVSGNDLPEDLSKYSLVVQCGGCMVNSKSMVNRVKIFEDANIPVTNYGILISFLTGILERSVQPFKDIIY